MIYDFDMIKKVYTELKNKHSRARELTGRPLTLTEKILFSHLDGGIDAAPTREHSYTYLNPDSYLQRQSPGGTTVPAPGSAVPESGAPSHQLHPVCHSG